MKKNIFKIVFTLLFAFFLVSCTGPVDPSTLPANEQAIEYGLPEGNYFKVTYVDGEITILEGIVREGTKELYVKGELTDIPTLEDKEGYKEKWSKGLEYVKEDIIIKAVYTLEEYNVSFIHYGKVVKTTKMKYGDVITEEDLPEIEDKYGIKSKSWDIEVPHTVKGILKINSKIEYIEFSETANAEFDELMEELFYSELGNDPMSITFNLYHPENFYKEGVFDFNECYFDGYEFSEEADKEACENCKYYIEILEGFDNETLTKDQYLSKIVLLERYKNLIRYEDFYYYTTLLGSYLGYQAQLPITLAEYRFDNKKTIDDYLSYIKYTQKVFEEIVKFENEKAEEGMPLTDVIINRVIEQCDEYINADSENPNFLVPVINNKIDTCDFLTDAEKEEYKQKNTTMVTENFVAAYTYLRNELEKMLGREDLVVLENGEEYIGSYAQMENGKEYYELLLQESLGTSMSVEEIYKYLNNLVRVNMGKYRENQEIINSISHGNVMMDKGLSLEDLIPFFMEAIKEDFPELDVELQYSISEIDPSLQENSSPAMYFISPIDDNLTESIYINPANRDLAFPSTYMYTTIAHEGYPGHLYQNVYMKNLDTLPNVRKLISSNSYAEGWAKHVEYYVYNYVYEDPEIDDIMLAADSLTYIIIGMLDIGVNYNGWNYEECKKFLSQYFVLDDEQIKDIMYDVTEIPGNYLMYYFSCYQLRDLMAEFEDLMGDDYSDKLYHKVILDAGSVSFDVLEYCLTDYYVENKLNK